MGGGFWEKHWDNPKEKRRRMWRVQPRTNADGTVFDGGTQVTQASRVRKMRLITKLKEELERDGWVVYMSGFPNMAAEKEGKMKFFVVNPVVQENPVVLGRRRDLLSEAFKRCFGVAFESYADEKGEEVPVPRKWL